MSFQNWKQSFYKDRICNKKNIYLWLNIHGINYDIIKYISKFFKDKIICKEREGKIYLSLNYIILTIEGLNKKYKYYIYSLKSTKDIIKQEYFKIFGNVCKRI